jgi:hypothetical protein
MHRDLRNHASIAERGLQADVIKGTGAQTCSRTVEDQAVATLGRRVEIQAATHPLEKPLPLGTHDNSPKSAGRMLRKTRPQVGE